MRELLLLSPVHIILGAFVVIVVSGRRSVIECLLPPDFNIEDLSVWLPPSVEVLKEHIV